VKKCFQKTARHGSNHRAGLGFNVLGLGYVGSPHYSAYYAYPAEVITVREVPPVSIQSGAPIIWKPRLLHDKYSQLMPPTVIKIAANYIGRFI
jgi:hypothetical protein